MPIKFRCNYCRQFLGISRAQAGGIVDCPTCGRSIRVPLLDGTLQPLPTPELNIQDTQLARALDELARLANVSEPILVENREPGGEKSDSEEEAENEFPQLIPEPIPIEVPIPPTPIAIQPPDQQDEMARSPTGGAAESLADIVGRDQSLLADLASLSPPTSPSQDDAPTRPTFESRSHLAPPSIPRISFMIVVTFVAGMLFERFVKVLESIGPVSRPTSTEAPAPETEASKKVTGRITIKSADGTSQPDRGARIIVLPQQRTSEIKLSAMGFRPSDSAADAKVAAAIAQAVGGDLAIADDDGQYRLEVPAGNYQILVLSHFQSRGEKEPLDTSMLKSLSAYFEKPEELLGRIKHQFGPLKVKGTGDVWDHAF